MKKPVRLICLAGVWLAWGALADEASLRNVGDGICRVDGLGEIADGGLFVDYSLRPEPGSEILCRIELPAVGKWTGELWGIGSSSQGGFISDLTEYSGQGHAVATTDLGTTSYEKGERRGKPWPEPVLRDYSWRATHLMTVYARRFVRAQYGRDAKHSYFCGGSCGGRQGFSEAMRFPEDYDGIISFIPAAMVVVANAQALNVYRQTHDAAGRELFTTNQLNLLAEAPIAYMKDRDVKPYAGSVLSNPFFSEADIDGLLAYVATQDAQLAAPEMQKRMRGIFLGVKDDLGRIVCHGMLPGTRHGNPAGLSFRSKGMCMASVLRDGAKYSKYPSWKEFEENVVARGGEINATSLDLTAFANRGGKLVVTCGWEDQTTPAPEVVAWYERLAEANGGYERTQRFCRLFPLPGVAHGGGRGRITTGGGAMRKTHRDDLRRWVEKDEAPETYPLLWRSRNLTLPIPPYPLQCYLDDAGAWRTRRYPPQMVRRPDMRYCRMTPLENNRPDAARSGDVPLLRLGIVSDLHHVTNDDGKRAQNCLVIEPAFRYFDSRKADGILVCGDLSDFGTVGSLLEIGAMWDRVFPNGRRSDGQPIVNLMHYGDHEMSTFMQNMKYRQWALEVSRDPDELNHFILDNDPAKVWEEAFHEKWAPIQVKTVKGYTFVLAHHPRHTSESDDGKRIPGLAAFLKTVKIDPAKPFFYSQHRPFEQGDTAEVLANYPNVIALHGHDHKSCVDELNLSQDLFVKIRVPSLNYCGMRYGRENSRQRFPTALMRAVDCSKSWQGLFATVYADRIVIERRDFLNGLPLGTDWVIPLPTPHADLRQEARAKRSVPPQFAAGARIAVTERTGENRKHERVEQVLVRFPVAHARGEALRAYDYEVTASVGGKVLKTRAVFSPGCFWADEKDIQPVVCPFAKSELPKDWRETVIFTVTPRDAFGNCGRPIVFGVLPDGNRS